jgi:hypothetical protein
MLEEEGEVVTDGDGEGEAARGTAGGAAQVPRRDWLIKHFARRADCFGRPTYTSYLLAVARPVGGPSLTKREVERAIS